MALLRDLPLSALRAFAVAARTLNLTRAAEELGVTPGAVSHQIRHLEESLGVKLIGRTGGGISITPAAERALPEIELGFRALATGVERVVSERERQTFTIAADPSFASLWLARHLEQVRDAVKPLDVRVVSTVPLHALATEGVDLAITYRKGLSSHLAAEHLFTERVIPACAPALAAKLADLDTANIASLPLLHIDPLLGDDVYPSWKDWFGAAGKNFADAGQGLRLGLSLAAAQAAVAGMGVVLASELILEPFLMSGHLVEIARRGPALTISRRLVWPENGAREGQARAATAALMQAAEAATPPRP